MKLNNIIKLTINFIIIVLLPYIVYAATVEDIIEYTIDEAVQPFIWLLMFVASVVFIWGVIEFISNAENGNKRSEGIKHMIWGIIGLFVMSTAAGILWVIVRFWNDVD